jgi:hypothetical protein
MTKEEDDVTVYNVYEPPEGDDADTLARADKVTFVKDGFNWVALIVPVFWLLFQRMWIELVVLLVLIAGLQWVFGAGEPGQQVAGLVTLALTVLFAFEANDLRGWALQRRGYRFAGTAVGRDRAEAERIFFTAWLKEQPRRPRVPKPAGDKSTPLVQTPAPRSSDTDEVIGSFPRG